MLTSPKVSRDNTHYHLTVVSAQDTFNLAISHSYVSPHITGANHVALVSHPTEPILQVDFSWRKFKTRISDSTTGKDIYIVDTNFMSPDLEFFYAGAVDGNDTSDPTSPTKEKNPIIKGPSFAAGNIHTFRIDAECQVHGREILLKPLKRFTTHYTHLSYAFPQGSDVPPVMLEWTTTSSFTNWDFICLHQETREPLVKFSSSNVWCVKKIGTIEFVGGGVMSRELKEELVVTGTTLFYCMLSRTQNVFAFFGAVFASTGQIGEDERGKLRGGGGGEEAVVVDVDGKAKVS